MPQVEIDRETIRKQALLMRGKKSLTLIGQELGVSRNVIAGIFFRTKHGPGVKSNGAGRGRVRGERPKEMIRAGGSKPGRECRGYVRKALGRIIELCKQPGAVHLRRDVLEIAEAACAYADMKREERRAKSKQARAC